MTYFNIMFDDLIDEAKQEYMEFIGVIDEDEINREHPLASIEICDDTFV